MGRSKLQRSDQSDPWALRRSLVIGDRDIWQAALPPVRRYGDDARLEAAQRAEQLLDEGDMAGAETWHRILNAIERLQAKAPAEGEKVHWTFTELVRLSPSKGAS